MYKEAKSDLDRSSKMQQKYDLAVCDVLHLIELENLSGPEMLALMKKLKMILKERRKHKDMHTHLQSFMTTQRTPEQMAVVQLETIKEDERDYSPRVFWRGSIKIDIDEFKNKIDKANV